jgi:DNA-directed RNA polymerase subunit RPC12/RpoP
MHSALEEHVRDAVCPQCHTKVQEPWQSEFFNLFHYLTSTCETCNYKLFYKTDIISNGIEK